VPRIDTMPAELVWRSCQAALEALTEGDTKSALGIIEDLGLGIYSYPKSQLTTAAPPRAAGRPVRRPQVLCPCLLEDGKTICGARCVRVGKSKTGGQRYKCKAATNPHRFTAGEEAATNE
jgi:hypothetical protein